MASENSILDLEHDRRFRHFDWAIQYVGWIIILGIIVCAITGVLGGGPLGHVTRGSADTFRIHYDRIMRQNAPAILKVHIGAALLSDSTVLVSVSQPLATTLNPQSFDPTPASVMVSGTTVTYRFHVSAHTDSASITIHCDPGALGTQHGAISVANMPALPVRIFVLP
jgi:hypothetical protein